MMDRVWQQTPENFANLDVRNVESKIKSFEPDKTVQYLMAIIMVLLAKWDQLAEQK